MRYEAHGHVLRIFDTEEKGASKFRVREFILETDGKYPQQLKFQVTKDRCDELDSLGIGEPVLVHFNIRGREWNGRYFNSLEVWKVDSTEHMEDKDERLQRAASDRRSRDYAHSGLDERGEDNDNIDTDIPF